MRSKGQPIRLFGETDKDRRLRLRALELIEEKGHDRQGGQNDFKKALEDVENNERELRSKNTKGKKKDDSDANANTVLDLGLVKSDPDKLYPLIYYALKRTLKDWEEAMDERPGMHNYNSCLVDAHFPFQITLSAQHKESWQQLPKSNPPNILNHFSKPFGRE